MDNGRPEGQISVDEVLRYLEQQDGYLSLQRAAAYLDMKPRKLREILPAELRFRVSGKTILVRKSELDQFLEKYRERPQADLKRLADEAVEAVLRK